MSVGFLFDCCLGRRAEPTGKGTAGTPALVRLPSSARLPPAGECARPPARLCGAAVGGRGERDHLRPEPLPCAGRGSGGSEGRDRARCLVLRATAAGAPSSSLAAPSAAKVYCCTTSPLPRPPLRPGLCGRRQSSQVTGGPIWVWMGPAGEGVAVTRCPLSAAGSTALRGPLPPHLLWGHWKAELRPTPCA